MNEGARDGVTENTSGRGCRNTPRMVLSAGGTTKLQGSALPIAADSPPDTSDQINRGKESTDTTLPTPKKERLKGDHAAAVERLDLHLMQQLGSLARPGWAAVTVSLCVGEISRVAA